MVKNVDNFDVNSISENSSTGYFPEVDLEYPDELHELHNDYPLAPENLAILYDILSHYCTKIADEYRVKVGVVMKLIPNLDNKTSYIVHCKNLQLYLSLGMRLTKIHRVLKLKQSDWMKKYIDFNTNKRTNFQIDDQFCLWQNNVKFTRKKCQTSKQRKTFFKMHQQNSWYYSQNYAAVHEIKPVLTLNISIYVGFIVLELSKWLMYEFHYNFVKRHFDAELLFTDTDSLTHEIKSEDVFE